MNNLIEYDISRFGNDEQDSLRARALHAFDRKPNEKVDESEMRKKNSANQKERKKRHRPQPQNAFPKFRKLLAFSMVPTIKTHVMSDGDDRKF